MDSSVVDLWLLVMMYNQDLLELCTWFYSSLGKGLHSKFLLFNLWKVQQDESILGGLECVGQVANT